MRHAPDTVFNNDDGTIHDKTEIKGAQAHQVGADMVGHHSAKGEQHREWDHERSDDRRTQVA